MSNPNPSLGRARHVALLVHRYVGLVISVFLLVAGATGCLLAFNEELDGAVNPELFYPKPSAPDAKLLDPVELAARIQQHKPDWDPGYEIRFDLKPEHSVQTWVEIEEDRYQQLFISPYTGELLGSREWGNLAEGMVNLMPFIYRLHYTLALGSVGVWLFGIVALLWTLDCFVGAYITFPTASPGTARGTPGGWFKRWLPAWLLRTNKLFSFIFTWHRASGLWVWAMLLVFAWSAVGLNLGDVYRPVMNATFGMDPDVHNLMPHKERPLPEPRLSREAAYAKAQEYMAAELAKRGATLKRERYFAYAADHGAFAYRVESDLDVSNRWPRTEVYLDGQTGAFIGFEGATGGKTGTTLTTWLYALHFGQVGGLWYRIFVSIMGFAIAALSVTGVWIWWKKRSKRVARASNAVWGTESVRLDSSVAYLRRANSSGNEGYPTD